MFKFKKIVTFFSLFCLILAFTSLAFAGREMRELPPMEQEMRSGDTPYAHLVRDTGGYVRYQLGSEGDIAKFDTSGTTRVHITDSGLTVFNSSGTATFSVDPNGRLNNNIALIDSYADLSSWSVQSTAGQSYYQVSGPTQEHLYVLVNTTAIAFEASGNSTVSVSGITIVAPEATATNHLKTFTVVKVDSSVTPVYIYGATSSSTTDYGHKTSDEVQTIQTWTSGTSETAVSAGGFSDAITTQGDSMTYMLYHTGVDGDAGGGVSAYMIRSNIANQNNKF